MFPFSIFIKPRVVANNIAVKKKQPISAELKNLLKKLILIDLENYTTKNVHIISRTAMIVKFTLTYLLLSYLYWNEL